MQKGHVTGKKRERQVRTATRERYRLLGEVIAARLATMNVQQLIGSTK